MPKFVKLWVSVGSRDLRIAIRPGETITRHYGALTDEGYSRGSITWTHEGTYIVRTYETDSRDCDGRHSSVSYDRCNLANIKAGWREGRRKFPAWEEAKRGRQRDYAAEAMGY